MGYLVLSRKYRPKTFEDVVGQAHITGTLQKAIESGRVAQAYIFSGTRGTGKTTMARILAKALNCATGPTASPCNSCEICTSIDTGQDVDVAEIDGASNNSVEDIRELRSNANYTPARARYKIYYIDEVHMLSTPAFNALLKTLEEPPAHVKFIFATTEPHKIPLTIQSRCQRFDFRNIGAEDLLGRLGWICKNEGIAAEEGALALVARFAAGSMRDAESLLDQVVSFSGDKITVEAVESVLGVVPAQAMSDLLRALAAGDTKAALTAIETVVGAGTSSRQFVAEFIDYLRDVLVAKSCGADSKLLVRSTGEREMLSGDAGKWSEEALVYAMGLLGETYARMARSPQTRGLLDVSIIKLARVDDWRHLAELVRSLRDGTVSAGETTEAEKQPPFEEPAGGPPARAASLGERAWEALVTAAKTQGTLVAKTLEAHAHVKVDDDKVRISLPENFALQQAALLRNEVRDALEAALGQALDRKVRLEVTRDASNGSAVVEDRTIVQRRKTLREQALLDPAVRKMMEVFDATFVDVEE